ncbi:hypothetical protein Dimus_034786 [Dionaea muscipula]
MWRSLWRSIDRFSPQYFRYIIDQLQGTKVVNNANRDIVIDILQSIVEIVTYGDRHDASIFECFMENQVLAEFVRLLKISGKSRIEAPLLHYLSIMIQNLHSEQTIYYCFTNEYINDVITHQYEFDGGDLAAYYVSFLRAVSGKLNRDTLCLLVKVQEDTVTSFPLYSEALKFAHHGEKMIQTAIRSVTLNIYNVSDDMVYRFITNPPVSKYFTDLVLGLREQCLWLDVNVHAMEYSSFTFPVKNAIKDPYTNDKLKELVSVAAKFVDDLFYIKDLFCVGQSRLSGLVTQKLLGLLVIPITSPFMQSNQNTGVRISPITSIFILARILQVVDRIEIINSVASLVLYPYVAPNAEHHIKLDATDVNSEADSLSDDVNKKEGIVSSSHQCHGVDRNQFWNSLERDSTDRDISNLNLDYVNRERKGIITNIFSENHVLFLASLMILLILAETKDLDPVLFPVIGFNRTKDESNDSSTADVLEESILMRCMPQVLNALLKILGSTSRSLVSIQWCAGWFLKKFVGLQQGALSHHELLLFNASFHQSRECLINELRGCWFDCIPDALIKEWARCKKDMEESSQNKDPFFLLELAFYEGSSDGSNFDTWQKMVDAVKVFVLHIQLKAYIFQGHLSKDLAISWLTNSMSSPRRSLVLDASSASFGSEVPLSSGVPCKIAFSEVGVRDIYMIPVAKGISGNLLLVEKHPFHSWRGTVLAMAPLAGLSPKIEHSHPTWLHLRIREFNPGDMDKRLHPNGYNQEVGGRWILRFPDAEACEAARLLIAEETRKQRSYVETLLAPFLNGESSEKYS